MTQPTAPTSPLRLGWVLAAIVMSMTVALSFGSTAAAQDDAETVDADATGAEAGGADDEALILGSEVYDSSCAACHQAGGTGLAGQFPPLVDNPNVEDSAYLEDVIVNGRSGTLEVNGETYDGVMPAVSGLGDEDIAAVITYIQSGFAAPAAGEEAVDPAANLADGALPTASEITWILAMLIAAVFILVVLGPRIIGPIDRLTMPWLDAWLKSAIIVVAIALLTIFVPNWVLNIDAVADLDAVVQELIASGLWAAGLAACLWALWYAQRKNRI